MAETVAIVGAGIAGLTAALVLARRGHPVALFEKAPRFEALGAGLQLSANALRVLQRLDLLEAVSAQAVSASSVVLRTYRSGRALAEVPVRSADGTGYLAVHRADLQEALVAAVRRESAIRLELGCEGADLREEADAVILSWRGADGGTREQRFPLLVAADGVHSPLGRALGWPPAHDTGLVAARFVAPTEPNAGNDGIEAWLGPKRHAVAYPMREGRECNVVLVAPRADTPEAILAGFAQWDRRLLRHLDPNGFRGTWPLFTSGADRPLTHGSRIAFVGDAAHAMLPFAAQGAAMAIEDAFVLAQSLPAPGEPGSLGGALEHYASERGARLAAVRRRVDFHRFTYHLPFPLSLGRDLTLALRSPERLALDLGWLYDWAPNADAL